MKYREKLKQCHEKIMVFQQSKFILQAVMAFKICLFINQHFNTIKYKNTNNEYAISWKSKGVYNSKLLNLQD